MPKIFSKILCPIGFDQNSVAALKFAYELADPDKSTLYLLHVVSVARMEPIMLEPNPVLSEGIAERELEKLVQQHASGLTPAPHIRWPNDTARHPASAFNEQLLIVSMADQVRLPTASARADAFSNGIEAPVHGAG